MFRTIKEEEISQVRMLVAKLRKEHCSSKGTMDEYK